MRGTSRKQVSAEVKRLQDEPRAAGGHMLDLVTTVKAVSAKHAADAPRSPDALAIHNKSNASELKE